MSLFGQLLEWIQNNQFIVIKKAFNWRPFFYSNKLLNLFLTIACLAITDNDITARFNNPNVYERADKQGFTDGRGGGFGSRSTGTNENFSNRTGRGRTGY